MNKNIVIINTIILFCLFSCNSTKNISQNNEERLLINKIQKVINFVSEDTVFIDRLKKHYPDLRECDSINIIQDPIIKPISIRYFGRASLIKTSFFKKYDTLNDLEFNEKKNQYNESNSFKEYVFNLSDKNNSKGCKIELTFSEEKNNLLPIKYTILDEGYIDPRINYHPRIGYFLIEFDNNDNILRMLYILRGN
ncbi:MAG: hypothetical protein BM557_07870 [Flavobacterium sp. MedPE-SWcel]|uniref:hypothetical protein n=1 Tax=uncultured Flavobacterium sp. TaxID=165435 RepID=UPI0009157E3C|nr:hypothetical protein [uncultured Flavobacterium sp.]OIQ18122.1 MAG: hypothetical protein BM557_07870 [Flavobacterium sp. MedPE-SWcel]